MLPGIMAVLVVCGLMLRLGTRTLLVAALLMPALGRLGTDSRLVGRLRLLMRRLRRAHLRVLVRLDLLVGLSLLMRLDLFMRLEMLPGAIFRPGRRGTYGRRAVAGLRHLVFNLCSLATPKLAPAAGGARCFMITNPGACMGKVSGTLGRQHLGPTAVVGSVQLGHTLRMLPVVTLLGGQPGVMLTHGRTVMFVGLRAHTTPAAVEADV
jgi:hypothetical protein